MEPYRRAGQARGHPLPRDDSWQHFREGVREFEKAFPGITVDHVQLNASAFAPRVLQERKGGLHSFDVVTSNYGTFGLTLIPSGVCDPIRESIFRGDVADDKLWQDGFEAGFIERQYGYAGFKEMYRAVWINTEFVQEGEVKTLEDLFNPKWKGRIIAGDPRVYGGGFWPGTTLRLKKGDDWARRLWKEQEPVFSRDQRQLLELLTRGRFAIGIGAVQHALLKDFEVEGLARNLKYVPMDEMDNLNYTSNIVYLVNRAPNPNAARVFINWLLTKEGSTIWSKYADTNSRRADVPPAAPDIAAPPGRKLILVDTEEVKHEFGRTQELAKQVLN